MGRKQPVTTDLFRPIVDIRMPGPLRGPSPASPAPTGTAQARRLVIFLREPACRREADSRDIRVYGNHQNKGKRPMARYCAPPGSAFKKSCPSYHEWPASARPSGRGRHTSWVTSRLVRPCRSRRSPAPAAPCPSAANQTHAAHPADTGRRSSAAPPRTVGSLGFSSVRSGHN